LRLGLNAIDLSGQLQIRWDRNAPAVQRGAAATLEIGEGGQLKAEPLDQPHLRAGVFTYARRGERVDVTLTVTQPDRRVAREATSFMGKLPAAELTESPEARQAREDAAKQAAEFKSALEAQTKRTKKLEKSLDDVMKQLKQQQQRRLQNQDAEPPK
jgi:hypothetical protein